MRNYPSRDRLGYAPISPSQKRVSTRNPDNWPSFIEYDGHIINVDVPIEWDGWRVTEIDGPVRS
jgi:hypothetical protein